MEQQMIKWSVYEMASSWDGKLIKWHETVNWWNKLMKQQVDGTTSFFVKQVDKMSSWWNNKLIKQTD